MPSQHYAVVWPYADPKHPETLNAPAGILVNAERIQGKHTSDEAAAKSINVKSGPWYVVALGTTKKDAADAFAALRERASVGARLTERADAQECMEEAEGALRKLIEKGERKRAELVEKLTDPSAGPDVVSHQVRWGYVGEVIKAEAEAGVATYILRAAAGDDDREPQNVIDAAARWLHELATRRLRRDSGTGQGVWSVAHDAAYQDGISSLMDSFGSLKGIVWRAAGCEQARAQLKLGPPPWESVLKTCPHFTTPELLGWSA